MTLKLAHTESYPSSQRLDLSTSEGESLIASAWILSAIQLQCLCRQIGNSVDIKSHPRLLLASRVAK